MRKLLAILGCIAAVFVVAAGAALALVDVNQFRGTIQAQLEKALHRNVTLGKMALKYIPLSIRVDNFAIAEDAAFRSGNPFVSADHMYVRAGLFALLQKRLELESVLLENPSVELIRSKAGDWNFSTLGPLSKTESPHAPGGAPSISLAQLRLENGTIGVTDYQSGKPRTVYDRIALRLSDYTPGRAFTAQLNAHLPGPNKEELGVKVGGVAGGSDLDGTFSLTDVTAGPVVLRGDGTLRIAGNSINIKSSLHAMGAKLRRPLQIESNTRYDRVSGKAVCDPLEVRLDRLIVRGRAESDTMATPVTLRADLRSDNAPIAELLTAAEAFGITHGVTGNGTLSMNVHLEGKADAPAYAGTVSVPEASVVPSAGSKPIRLQSANVQVTSSEPLAGHLRAGALAFDQIALNDVASAFRFAGGILHLDNISAHAFGGAVAGNIGIDTRGSAFKLAAATKLSNVDANKLLTATTAVKVLSGKLSGDADLQLAPPPGGNPAAGLDGTVRILLTEGAISGVSLLDNLGQVGRFLGGADTSSKSFTSISKLAGTMRIQSGVARTDDLQLDFDGGSLSATGAANLADETLDLSIAALLTKEVSQRVGGSKVGGLMTTVMASPRGELMIPAKVTGTFSKPRFQPDPARLAKLRFGNVSSATATVDSLLQQITKPKSGQDSGKQSPADKAKPFTDLLNAIGGKK